MHTLHSPIQVLVLAVGGNVSQGILKALASCSLPTRVIGTDISELQMGLYTVDRGYIAPHATSPGFIDWLISLCIKEHVDVILTGCEPVLRSLVYARRRVEDATGALCLVCPPEVWALCDDKYLTCRWLEESGFPFPGYAAAEDSIAVECLVQTCGFPLIAKPRIGGGASGVFTVRDGDDLAYVVRKPGYMLEEYLGTDDQEYTVGCFCDRDGVVRGSIALWRELLSGTTYRAQAGAFPEITQAATDIAGALHTIGPCNIQMRMTTRGPVCFEINPRFSGTTPMRAAMGFNEVEASLRHFLIGESSVSLPKVTSGVALRYWNELYVSPEECQKLLQDGYRDHDPDTPARPETYGMDGCAFS